MTTGYQWAKKTKTRQLLNELRKPKRNKFNAVKVKLDGHTFDSKAEAKRYGELKLLEKAGKIFNLAIHPKYELAVNGLTIATYKPDFYYTIGRSAYFLEYREVVEDVKSAPTAAKRDFILIRKLMRAIHGIDVEIISAGSRSITAADPFGLEAA